MDKPSGGFFKGGRRAKARDQLGLPRPPPGFRGAGDRRRSRPRSATLSRIPAGPGGPPIPGSSLPTGEREGSQRDLQSERRPTLPCAARDGAPSRASTLTRRGRWGGLPRSLDCTQGRGKAPREPPGSENLGFGARRTGFPPVAHPLIEPPFRATDHRVRLPETVPTSPPASRCDLPSPSYGRFPGPICKLATRRSTAGGSGDPHGGPRPILRGGPSAGTFHTYVMVEVGQNTRT